MAEKIKNNIVINKKDNTNIHNKSIIDNIPIVGNTIKIKKPIKGTIVKHIYDEYESTKNKFLNNLEESGRYINTIINPNIKGNTQNRKYTGTKIPQNAGVITNAIRNNIPLPTNISQLIASGIMGDKKYSIANAPKNIQKELFKSIVNAHKRNTSEGYLDNRILGTEYKDYSPKMGELIQQGKLNSIETLAGSLLSDEFNAATTFGRVSYKYNEDKKSYDVYDSYDFNKLTPSNSGYSKFRGMVGDIAEGIGISNKKSDANYIGTFNIDEFNKQKDSMLNVPMTSITNLEDNINNGLKTINSKINTGINNAYNNIQNMTKFKKGGGGKPKYFAGGANIAKGLGLASGVASMIPGGQIIGAGLGLIGGIVGAVNANDEQKAAVEAQNKITAQNEAIQLEQRMDVEKINQRNFGSNSQMNSFYKLGGNMKPKYASGGELQPVTEDGIIVNGKPHEQGGVDYGDIEVEKGETIKKEADGDFVFSTEFKPDGKNDAGTISKSLFQKKQILQQQSGLITEDITTQQNALKTSPSRIDSNTKGREVSRGQFKQKNIESQIQQTDAAIEMLKQQQIQWGQEQGIYDAEGNNIVADQPLEQQEQPMARQGGNFKPKFEGGGKFIDGVWVKDLEYKGKSILDKSNINSNKIDNTWNPKITGVTPTSFNPAITGFGNNKLNPNWRDTSKDIASVADTKPTSAKPFKINDNKISTGIDIASTLVNYASNAATAKNMANLKVPGYIPIQSVKTGRVNTEADKNEIIRQGKDYNKWAENNVANPQQAAIMKQAMRNQSQQQLDKVNQYQHNADVQVEDQNASRNLQTQQINNAGLQDYNQRLLNKSTTDIQNQANVTGALLKDVKETIGNRERLTQQDRMYDLYKLKYENTPGVGRDITNAIDGTKLTKEQYLEGIKAGKIDPNDKRYTIIARKGGKMKPKFIANK